MFRRWNKMSMTSVLDKKLAVYLKEERLIDMGLGVEVR